MKPIIVRCQNQIILSIAILFVTFNISAQNWQKKQYTSDKDSLWSRSTYIYKMTTNGKWVALMEAFDHKENILLLKHTTDTISFKFPESQWIMFSDNNRWFGCIASNKELHLIDLNTLTKDSYTDIESYKFSKSGDFVAALQKNEDRIGTLLIINLKTKAVSPIEGVIKYVWHPKRNSLLIAINKEDQNKTVLYDIDDLSLKVLKENHNSSYNHLLWSSSGNTLVFTEQINQKNSLHHYQLDGVIKTLDDITIENKFPQSNISNLAPFVSSDGKKILFYRQINKESPFDKKNTWEVWNTEDPWIYPKMKEHEEREVQSQLTAWYPEANELIVIETEGQPTAALNINHDYAVVYDKLQYEPLYKEFPNVDIYAKNMKNGQTHLVVQNQYTGAAFVSISPYGKYITYFKNKHWWVYDIKRGQTKNITKDLGVSFENLERDRAGDVYPYGNPGWSENDEFIILYDQYDIWLISPDGCYREKITKGREEKIKYRINRDYRRNNYHYLTVNIHLSSSPFNLDKEIILEMYDDLHKTGYALWNRENKIRRMIFEDRKMDDILISEDFSNIVFRKQKFNQPPGIYNLNTEKNKQHLIYQSNKELLNYDLGRAELIKYTLDKAVLSGSLLYPANFNPQKKYPMVVCIYEKSSSQLNVFNSPSDYGYVGFNPLKYTANGYFVLYPDISYTIGDPGVSALNCVTAAVNKALESGYVDKNKIGLIGHSFGGYESAFIATQTDLFAAIVAGASVTNFTSHYHGVGWNFNQPEMWRYESQQWRMGDSYYNSKDAYLRNSPIHHVENVRTPLLLWTGKEDYQVSWMQSIEMFLALKRLDKKSKLLLFENETHGLKDKENQKKLSSEIMDWFERYCK